MASAFSQTVSAKLTFDADGLPTGITGAVKEDLFAGTLKALTAKFDGDTVVKGLGATIADVGLSYGSMQLTRKMLVGNFAFNPLATA